ncbi:MAG: hypothetical protein BJ554DRAFT_4091 [Olpidium bornovanus]|uniref:Uncharacterized protein n=1 Tax=Olpidium bornovanus TaxID=278681 RepID=A0A8H7ZN78_9FUNG|nr:MAG: hypothetical protein BJ554DRAFT_4091 [Olpidium bornovanus]
MLTSKKLKKLAPPYSEQVPEMRFFEALYDVVLTVIKMVFPSPTSVPIIEKEHGRVFRSRYFNIATHRTPEFAALADKLGPKPEKFDWKTFVDVAEVRPNQEDEAFELGESYTAAAGAGDHVAEDARARTAQEAAPRVAAGATIRTPATTIQLAKPVPEHKDSAGDRGAAAAGSQKSRGVQRGGDGRQARAAGVGSGHLH